MNIFNKETKINQKNKRYFCDLNYTFTNEDTLLEFEVMREQEEHLLVIAGSGARVIPLIARGPKEITCLDLSEKQLLLTKLRVKCVEILSYDEFLLFWGHPFSIVYKDYSLQELIAERKKLIETTLIPQLDPIKESDKEILNFLNSDVLSSKELSLLYEGKWEKAITALGAFLRFLTQKKGSEIRRKDISSFSFKLALFLAGNRAILDALLYKGNHPIKNIKESYYSYYFSLFEKLFKLSEDSGLKQNYFLQFILSGKLSGVDLAINKDEKMFLDYPPEADPQIYLKMKAHINSVKINYIKGDLKDLLLNREGSDQKSSPFSFVSLSDIPSYFSGDFEHNFLQKLKPHLSSMGRIVSRYYLRVPTNVNTTSYNLLNEKFQRNINKERTQIYQIEIWEKCRD